MDRLKVMDSIYQVSRLFTDIVSDCQRTDNEHLKNCNVFRQIEFFKAIDTLRRETKPKDETPDIGLMGNLDDG